MKSLSLSSSFIVILAALGGILYNDPTLCFHIPIIGFLPWILITGKNVPFLDADGMAHCIDPEKCPWLTEKDVLVNACAKCGTNWMMTVVHELRTWDRPDLKEFDDILEVSPWVDIFQHPQDSTDTRYLSWGSRWNSTEYPFKMYKGHMYPYREEHGIREVLVPVKERTDLKFIVMVRNPFDMVVSLSKFGATHTKEWYSQWGMPTPFDNLDMFLFVMSNIGKTSNPYYFFAHWWDYRDDPNVLLLHYSNVFKDQKKYLKIIANFLELTNITSEKLDDVLYRTSVDFMKTRNDKYRHMVGKNKSIPIIKPSSELKGEGLIRKGGVGKGKSALSESQKQYLKDMSQGFLTPDLMKIVEQGFEVDPDTFNIIY